MGGNAYTDPNPLELLQEELSQDEVYVKVNAIHRLQIVATVLGPENTRNQLIPYLNSTFQIGLLESQEDEVLFALAQELGYLHKYINGSPSVLIPILEQLAAMEETVVREQAVKSISLIANYLSEADATNIMAPMLQKLVTADKFSGRVSACGLFSTIYPRCGAHKERLRAKFLELCNEESPIVRRAAASQVGEFCKVIEKEMLVSAIIPVFKQLCQDEQDQVRILCMDSLISIAQLLSREDNRIHVIPVIIALGEDKSWKVKMHIASKFPQLLETLGKDVTENSLIQTFVQLLRDNELEVRVSTLKSLYAIIPELSIERLQALIYPAVSSLAMDPSCNVNVRKNVVDVLGSMSRKFDKEFTTARLLPLIMEMLNDANNDVKIHALKTLQTFGEQTGAELLNDNLVQTIFSLMRDCMNWRVREAIVGLTARLGIIVGPDHFVRSLQDLYFLFLNDSVSSVRVSGVKELSDLASTLGDAWVAQHLVPKLQSAYGQNLGYLHRITVIQCIGQLRNSIEPTLALLNQAVRDPVPNVRFALCKVAKQLGGRATSLRSVIEELAKDADPDVAYFASQALGSLQQHFQKSMSDLAHFNPQSMFQQRSTPVTFNDNSEFEQEYQEIVQQINSEFQSFYNSQDSGEIITDSERFRLIRLYNQLSHTNQKKSRKVHELKQQCEFMEKAQGRVSRDESLQGAMDFFYLTMPQQPKQVKQMLNPEVRKIRSKLDKMKKKQLAEDQINYSLNMMLNRSWKQVKNIKVQMEECNLILLRISKYNEEIKHTELKATSHLVSSQNALVRKKNEISNQKVKASNVFNKKQNTHSMVKSLISKSLNLLTHHSLIKKVSYIQKATRKRQKYTVAYNMKLGEYYAQKSIQEDAQNRIEQIQKSIQNLLTFQHDSSYRKMPYEQQIVGNFRALQYKVRAQERIYLMLSLNKQQLMIEKERAQNELQGYSDALMHYPDRIQALQQKMQNFSLTHSKSFNQMQIDLDENPQQTKQFVAKQERLSLYIYSTMIASMDKVRFIIQNIHTKGKDPGNMDLDIIMEQLIQMLKGFMIKQKKQKSRIQRGRRQNQLKTSIINNYIPYTGVEMENMFLKFFPQQIKNAQKFAYKMTSSTILKYFIDRTSILKFLEQHQK